MREWRDSILPRGTGDGCARKRTAEPLVVTLSLTLCGTLRKSIHNCRTLIELQ